MRFAALADIHGNGEALRAVLADLDAHGGADRLLVPPSPPLAPPLSPKFGRKGRGLGGPAGLPTTL